MINNIIKYIVYFCAAVYDVLLMDLKFFYERIIKTSYTAISFDRIPDELKETAKQGEYSRAIEYPLEHIKKEFKTKKFITKQTKIVTLGSCFAQELSKWLENNGFCNMPNIWGVIYSPRSLAQIIRYIFYPKERPVNEEFWIINGQYFDPYLKAKDHSGAVKRGNSIREAASEQELYYEEGRRIFMDCDLLVFTLGLTEIWQNKLYKYAYYSIPFPHIYNPEIHEFYNMSYMDVVNDLEYSIQTLIKYNTKLKILLSVSPVPLSISFRAHLGPFVASNYSKSVLHAAALYMYEKYEEVYYMPSYEIARINPFLNYKKDGRHVEARCVNSIMMTFNDLFVHK